MKLGIANIAMVYGLTAGIFFIIDLFWLGAAARGLYDRHIGGLLRDQVNWAAAVLFYLIYIGGILVFVQIPALSGNWSILRVALYGGMLGFFAYATFDLTSLALIRNWSVTITVVDLIWGTVLTGSTAALSVWLGRLLIRAG
jgi:uncharacterized membrane protein